MIKLVTLTAALVATLATGCTLYFGEGADDDDGWSGTPMPPGGGGGGPGYGCEAHAECAAGCYCSAQGVCEESSYCISDFDCGIGWSCAESLSTCVPGELAPEVVCGDGIVEGAESCDDGGRADGDGCTAACVLEAACGNGLREPGEACDDGNRVAGDGCDADCFVEVSCADHDEATCLAAPTCEAVYQGLGCTGVGGGACQTGEAGCTCEDFVFDRCRDA